jgi:iron only hydrogenase large subunit-like protein
VRPIDGVLQALEDPVQTVVVQTAPAIRAALGEEFGYPPGTLVTGKMIAALRALGFDRVFDITFAGTAHEWSFLEGVEVRVAVAHGLGNATKLLKRIKTGEASYHFVEVMTCPGGCIGGGGQPRFTTDAVREARIAAIYREDEGKPLRTSHTNPAVRELYEGYLGSPLGERSHHLLPTRYAPRSVGGIPRN